MKRSQVGDLAEREINLWTLRMQKTSNAHFLLINIFREPQLFQMENTGTYYAYSVVSCYLCRSRL